MKRFLKKSVGILLMLVLVITLLPAKDVAKGASTGVDSGSPTGAPGSIAITHDNWSGKATYDITFNIWWGNNGTTYKLYEDNVVIDSGNLVANSPNGQSKTVTVSKTKNGTYSYKYEVTNSYGTSISNTITVNVTNATGDVTIDTVKSPVFSPNGGTYSNQQKVAMSSATQGAQIRYTLDGTNPNEQSSIYIEPIIIDKTTTVKAYAFKSGMKDSSVVVATYTIQGGNADDDVVIATDWKSYVNYKAGDIVTYNKKHFECRQPHLSLPGWEPSSIPALWLETTAPIITATPTTSVNPSPSVTPTPSVIPSPSVTPTPSYKPVSGLPSKILIGYWHSWGGGPAGGVPLVKLRDVDDNWDVINISFAEPVSPGSNDGKMKLELAGLSSDYTKEDFKKDIKDLQARGKKIVLSIGGYEGYFSLTSSAAINQFVSDIKGFINEYGFDGIDIDLEQSSVTFDSGNDPDYRNPKTPKIVNMITAIRQICDAYGDDFILSWAPETFYAQLGYQYYGGLNAGCDSRGGVYLPMINALRDKTTYVHVQLYNSIVVTAPDGKTYSMGSTESTVAMCKMLLDGFNVGGKEEYFFEPLRPDQIAIGVPSSTGAAGSGHISNANLQAAFTILNKEYPTLRGIMTWSLSWDAFQNKNSFAISNGTYLKSLR